MTDRTHTWKPDIRLVLFIGISFFMLAIGGWLTMLGIGSWYKNLAVPDWQPPSSVFTPAWTVLLTLLAIATWLVVRKTSGRLLGLVLGLYAIQVVLNVGWSLFFFTLHSPLAALYDIVVLDIILVMMVLVYGRVSILAGLLILPYALWLFFATAINYWIVINN